MLIIEKMEKMVDPDQPEGEWITKYDLVEKVRHSALHCVCACQNCRSVIMVQYCLQASCLPPCFAL